MNKFEFTKKTLSEGKKHHVYIASPFFNPNQVTRVELVETLLEKLGISYFSPRKHSQLGDIQNPEERAKIFALNEESISAAEFVIAITDDKDTGTIWEAGCAFARNIPVVYVAFSLLPPQSFNLMLSESGYAVCRNKEQLEHVLTTGESIKYNGLSE